MHSHCRLRLPRDLKFTWSINYDLKYGRKSAQDFELVADVLGGALSAEFDEMDSDYRVFFYKYIPLHPFNGKVIGR